MAPRIRPISPSIQHSKEVILPYTAASMSSTGTTKSQQRSSSSVSISIINRIIILGFVFTAYSVFLLLHASRYGYYNYADSNNSATVDPSSIASSIESNQGILLQNESEQQVRNSIFSLRSNKFLFSPKSELINDDNRKRNNNDISSPWPIAAAWLMSFPNSGTSYTIHLIRGITNTTTATNYGLEGDIKDEESVPAISNSENGPFL
eukprot:3890622-Ditylum_brightwellii.AAC.1